MKNKDFKKRTRCLIDVSYDELLILDQIIIAKLKREPTTRPSRASVFRQLFRLGLERYEEQNPGVLDNCD
jgi:hypothetical protein